MLAIKCMIHNKLWFYIRPSFTIKGYTSNIILTEHSNIFGKNHDTPNIFLNTLLIFKNQLNFTTCMLKVCEFFYELFLIQIFIKG